MEIRHHRDLSNEELIVWDSVAEFTEKNSRIPGIALSGTNAYYFTADRFFFLEDPMHVFKEDPNVSLELLVSTKVEKPRGKGEEPDIKNGPMLYLLSGHPKTQNYIDSALKNISQTFSLLTHNHWGTITVTNFPRFEPESVDNDRWEIQSFFSHRGISSGVYPITSINDSVIDLFFQLDRLAEFIEVGSLNRISSTREHSASNIENCLAYDGQTSKVFFQFGITREDDLDDEELVDGLRSMFSFIFDNVLLFAKRGIDFSEYLPKLLKVPLADLESLLNPLGGIDLFFERWNDEPDYVWQKGGDRRPWVDPDFIQVFISIPRFDPSFGKPTEYSQETVVLAESRTNFKQTNFDGISPSSYLERLMRQGVELSHVEKAY
jgi:hypothetical protein